MGKLLVTGASGNVGGYVARYALQGGQEVRLAGSRPEALRAQFGGAAGAVGFDFTDPATFAPALEGVDRVFVMRPPQMGKPEDLKPFVEAMRDRGGIRLVCFLSLIGVEHNPVPPHHKIEKYIEQAGLPYCHIRPSFFMQNLSGVHAFEIRHFDRIVAPVGRALTSFIDAEAIGYDQAAAILSQELGRTITYADPKPSLAKRYWTDVRGLDREYAAVMGMLYLMTRMGTAKTVTDTFEAVMGKAPQTFRDFVRKNRAAWQKP